MPTNLYNLVGNDIVRDDGTVVLSLDESINVSWDDCLIHEPGHLYLNVEVDGIKLVVMKTLLIFTAYMGVPHAPTHLDPNIEPNLGVHGGITHVGTHRLLPPGYWYYGWAYEEWGDSTFPCEDMGWAVVGHNWTPREIIEEVLLALPNFLTWLKREEE